MSGGCLDHGAPASEWMPSWMRRPSQVMGPPVTGGLFSSVFTRSNLSSLWIRTKALKPGRECKVPSERFGKMVEERRLASGENPGEAQWLFPGLTEAGRAWRSIRGLTNGVLFPLPSSTACAIFLHSTLLTEHKLLKVKVLRIP